MKTDKNIKWEKVNYSWKTFNVMNEEEQKDAVKNYIKRNAQDIFQYDKKIRTEYLKMKERLQAIGIEKALVVMDNKGHYKVIEQTILYNVDEAPKYIENLMKFASVDERKRLEFMSETIKMNNIPGTMQKIYSLYLRLREGGNKTKTELVMSDLLGKKKIRPENIEKYSAWMSDKEKSENVKNKLKEAKLKGMFQERGGQVEQTQAIMLFLRESIVENKSVLEKLLEIRLNEETEKINGFLQTCDVASKLDGMAREMLKDSGLIPSEIKK